MKKHNKTNYILIIAGICFLFGWFSVLSPFWGIGIECDLWLYGSGAGLLLSMILFLIWVIVRPIE